VWCFYVLNRAPQASILELQKFLEDVRCVRLHFIVSIHRCHCVVMGWPLNAHWIGYVLCPLMSNNSNHLQAKKNIETEKTEVSHTHPKPMAVPPCVNGDITIQWEWSNFDPSQKPNPLTNYDKTLYNWYTSMSRTRNPRFLQIGDMGAPGQIREI